MPRLVLFDLHSSMARLQRVSGPLLRALASASALEAGTFSGLSSRSFSAYLQPLPPAATYQDVADDWYMRQRSIIALGNRMPHLAATAWVAPSAVVVGSVDLYDKVSSACGLL